MRNKLTFLTMLLSDAISKAGFTATEEEANKLRVSGEAWKKAMTNIITKGGSAIALVV